MISSFVGFLRFFDASFRSRHSLCMEILAPRPQLGTLKQKRPRPRLRIQDRIFGILLCRPWCVQGAGVRGLLELSASVPVDARSKQGDGGYSESSDPKGSKAIPGIGALRPRLWRKSVSARALSRSGRPISNECGITMGFPGTVPSLYLLVKQMQRRIHI